MKIRKSKRAPVLITLETSGWEKDSIKIIKKNANEHYVVKLIAIHDPIAHMLGKPDVRILSKPTPCRISYIIKIINHETIHHILADLLLKDSFDELLDSLPNNHWLKRMFL
jgi:hypothetical protein